MRIFDSLSALIEHLIKSLDDHFITSKSIASKKSFKYNVQNKGVSLSVSDEQAPYDSKARQTKEIIYNQLLESKSLDMLRVIEKINLVAETDFTVIIQGETGTGKTMIARLLHMLSKRNSKPFVHVDINAVPESLIETELFGYEKGSFTGAYRRKRGFFESANGGTIFFDDIQNLSNKVQGKILSVVEEKMFYPVGTATPINIDVRLIVATNIDISVSLMDKTFRDDLFYRLGEFFITVPPLRHRREDISELFRRFIEDAGSELNRKIKGISNDVIVMLKQYHWPGNIRELKNVARRAALMCKGGVILPEHVELLSQQVLPFVEDVSIMPLKVCTSKVVRQTEISAIKHALLFTGGNKKKAADLLEIDYKTLISKIRVYGIE
ncbi:MAG: sigma-54-dependent Fis family transcriptional regulator [Nitrospirae bacterium]|nr:sigma-54-dependent Fis family transcriptional regulator [Nitrospirota bacterium]